MQTLIEDAHDARVAQTRQGVDLALQALEHLLAGHTHGLERHGLAALLVLRAPDHAHTALSQRLDQAVQPDASGLLGHVAPPSQTLPMRRVYPSRGPQGSCA
jgi:hypothetical protein